MDYVISASYGNDSMAMLQWAHEHGLQNVTVTYCDTGWAAPGWDARVGAGETVAKRMGFEVVRLSSMGMESLVRMKNGFPGNGRQFCTAWLKGLPFLQWIDEADPECKAVVMIGKRSLRRSALNAVLGGISTEKDMELKELAGEHLLDAVDFSNEQVKTWGEQFEDCQVMRFRLDGKVYVAVEDPDDGYRSHMKDLTVSEDATMKNVFKPVKVIGRHREKGRYGDVDDVLELIDAGTGQLVLEVGTESTNDYYPCFVASFHPEAMTPNAVLRGEPLAASPLENTVMRGG